MSGPVHETPLDHSYDGIQEYDNPTPGWWWMLFVVTVLFSIVYYTFFSFSPIAWTAADDYNAELSRRLRAQFSEIGTLEPDEATLLRYMHDEKWLLVGKSTFQANCARCHGAEASGGVGPNLTDEYFKNIHKLEDIAHVITNGANNGLMPPWKKLLHPNELVLTAAYVASLRGQNLAGRPAEGEQIPPWPTPPPPTSTQEGN